MTTEVLSSTHGPGTVGISCQELARYSMFTWAWSHLKIPYGTQDILRCGYDTACNTNDIIKMMRPDDEWVFIMDDDHVFAPELLMNLIARDVDVVVPLYTQRQPPFSPCAYKRQLENGAFEIFDWEDLDGKSGLLPVASAGKAGILIRRHVIEKLGYPWFEWAGLIGEDHTFFKKCQDAGFQTYVDLDNHMEHLSTFAIQPHKREDGTWVGRVALSATVFTDVRATRIVQPT